MLLLTYLITKQIQIHNWDAGSFFLKKIEIMAVLGLNVFSEILIFHKLSF